MYKRQITALNQNNVSVDASRIQKMKVRGWKPPQTYRACIKDKVHCLYCTHTPTVHIF